MTGIQPVTGLSKEPSCVCSPPFSDRTESRFALSLMDGISASLWGRATSASEIGMKRLLNVPLGAEAVKAVLG